MPAGSGGMPRSEKRERHASHDQAAVGHLIRGGRESFLRDRKERRGIHDLRL